MTDVLDPTDRAARPVGGEGTAPAAAGGRAPGAEPGRAVAGGTAAGADDRASGLVEAEDLVRWGAAAVNLGAALVHFAYAQGHLDEEASHGAFFLAAGWAQLALALGLGLRLQPRRAWAAACGLVNAGVLGVWVVSRTVGVPGNDPESVGLADATAAGLEVVAALAAAVLLMGTVAAVSARRPNLGAVGVGALLLGGLVTASVTPAFAGDHSHGAGGHGAGGHAAGAHDDMASGDGHADGHAAGGASGDDWQATRLAALAGYQPPEVQAEFRQVNIDYLSEQLRTRSEFLQGLPEAEREERIATFAAWSVDNALEGENGASTGGEATMHSHGPTEWQPIEDAEDQALLQQQLQEGGTVIGQFPTAGDAMRGGYIQVTPYVPGIGAHYLSIDRLLDGEFVAGEPEMLLYNGNEQTSELVGLSYGVFAAEPPEGFVGPNDIWHTHPSLCTVGGTFVVGPDHTPDELCASIGGEKGNGGRMQMTHLWQVPGWESPWGLFSGENPNLNIVTTEVGK